MSMKMGGGSSGGSPIPTVAGMEGQDVNAEINVTPMIDVMLVLLIIFMVITPAMAGYKATLPKAVTALCADIMARHGIRRQDVLAHSDTAPTRKTDPGELFPWDRLAAAGIGLHVAPAPLQAGPSYGPGEEAFARLAKWMSANPVRQPGPYLQRIARNLLVDRARQSRSRPLSDYLPISDDLVLSVPPDQMHRLEANDVLEIYRRALDELPPRTREVFLLHRVDELTYKEIGARLEISIPTVQYHVARALTHLDAALGQE